MSAGKYGTILLHVSVIVKASYVALMCPICFRVLVVTKPIRL